MATKAERGTKRTCQSGSCGSRFYDLNRDPIVCPICGSVYVIATAPPVTAAADAASQRRVAKKPDVEASADTPELAGDDALADVEAGDDAMSTDDDETFLEEEEDEGGDVSGIIGGGPEGDDES
ncbi:MAG: TIGR02300 family protein [Hyphomicrobiaceae bacterium]